ncbi:mitochondrial DUF273 domain-containing protein [Andalucia godoyi]|uniref:Mitochondrial DUF273 domain-containing protein n=1 Tax=Andalucia godoyi TaxID=505711 RepID=A0A8K0AGJ9_ANDGO|nr:mitochondrial DUF273 domain-containing protein [Andalucia godoyi]|eukprot:ANDGO_00467.mRNA.1 mitochondrial DUF273 domain-containing protein
MRECASPNVRRWLWPWSSWLRVVRGRNRDSGSLFFTAAGTLGFLVMVAVAVLWFGGAGENEAGVEMGPMDVYREARLPQSYFEGCDNATTAVAEVVGALEETHARLVERVARIHARFWRIEDFIDRRIPDEYFNTDHRAHWASRASASLPRLAIVSTVTPVLMSGHELEQTTMNCYAAHHGYSFYPETVVLQRDRPLATGRFRGLQKYLPHFQWVVHISHDITVVNRSKKIEPFLDDGFDVVLTRKSGNRNRGATAIETTTFSTDLIMVRNSAGGRQFVSDLMALSDDGRRGMRADEGDLHEALLRLLFSKHDYEHCAHPHIQFRSQHHHDHNDDDDDDDDDDAFDAWMAMIRQSPCASLFTQSEWNSGPVRIKMLDAAMMVRDPIECVSSRPKAPAPLKFLRCSDFFIHRCTEHLTTDDMYCLPVKNDGVSRPDLFLSEADSAQYAAQLGYDSYIGCSGINLA